MCRNSRFALSLTLAVMMSSCLGCATLQMPFGKRMPKASAADPATQILCLWQPGDGQDPKGMPCKGFHGQILFLSSRKATPVQIEGEVMIYIFDDQGTPEEQAKPIHRYQFDNGSWAIHLAKTSFGPAYSVFVPYPKHGITDANCSMRVRLKPKQGPTIFSEFSNMQLNGNKKIQRGEDAKPSTSEEVDHLTAEILADTIRRTTTIPTSPQPKTIATVAGTTPESEANQVKLASHEVVTETAKPSAEAERIRQLEMMVQQLLDQKANVTSAPARSIQGSFEPDQLAENPAEDESGERLKMGRPRTSRRKAEPTPVRSSGRRQTHPLDDDQYERSSRRLNESDLAREPQIGDPFDSPLERPSRE